MFIERPSQSFRLIEFEGEVLDELLRERVHAPELSLLTDGYSQEKEIHHLQIEPLSAEESTQIPRRDPGLRTQRQGREQLNPPSDLL